MSWRTSRARAGGWIVAAEAAPAQMGRSWARHGSGFGSGISGSGRPWERARGERAPVRRESIWACRAQGWAPARARARHSSRRDCCGPTWRAGSRGSAGGRNHGTVVGGFGIVGLTGTPCRKLKKKTKHDLKLCCRPAGSGSEGVARWRPAARSTKKEQTGNCRGAKTGVDRDCPAEGVRVMEQEGASSSFLLGLRVDRRAKEGGSSSRRRSLPRAKVNKSSSHKWTTADVTRGNLQILVARASSLSASAA